MKLREMADKKTHVPGAFSVLNCLLPPEQQITDLLNADSETIILIVEARIKALEAGAPEQTSDEKESLSRALFVAQKIVKHCTETRERLSNDFLETI